MAPTVCTRGSVHLFTQPVPRRSFLPYCRCASKKNTDPTPSSREPEPELDSTLLSTQGIVWSFYEEYIQELKREEIESSFEVVSSALSSAHRREVFFKSLLAVQCRVNSFWAFNEFYKSLVVQTVLIVAAVVGGNIFLGRSVLSELRPPWDGMCLALLVGGIQAAFQVALKVWDFAGFRATRRVNEPSEVIFLPFVCYVLLSVLSISHPKNIL